LHCQIKTDNTMVEVVKFIAVNLFGDEEKVYFRTEQTREAYGNTYYVFCRMKPIEEISWGDFWSISERYFNELKAQGKLREVERFCDLLK